MRDFFVVEKGFRTVSENSDVGVSYLFGAGAPGGTTETDDAEQGSSYKRTNGEFYIKKTSGSGTDKWIRMASLDDITGLSWRSEKVLVATGDVAPSSGATIDLTANPFGDDEGTLVTAADFAVDDYIIFGVGGTPKLMRVSVVSAPNITVVDAADPLADNDMMIVRKYLPDTGDSQEVQAIVHYNGTDIVKLSDFNWSLATGINLSAGYTPASGDISVGEVLESAIEKLDGNNDAQDTLLGRPQGSTHLGTFTGDVISDNTTVKNALQELESEVIRLDGQLSQDNVTTAVVLDELLVDNVLAAEWLVTAALVSDPTRKRTFKLHAVHDGHSGADAANVDETQYGVVKTGASISTTVSVVLSGSGASQVLRLQVAAGAATHFRAKRIGVVEANGV